MPAKLERCVKHVMAQGRPESSAWAICQSRMKDGACEAQRTDAPCAMLAQDSYRGGFIDSIPYDPTTKTAVSVRDGVLEYLGAELGLLPEDKIFRVYRSAATIANAATAMPGIPVTNEHVALDMEPPTNGGRVDTSKMVDLEDESHASHVAVQNTFTLSDTMAQAVDAGKRELSLGYCAQLVPHEIYDFEQRDIVPHHVAVVDRGRCGPMCSFLDKSPREDMSVHKAFLDADGALNLQQIVELATALPEAIKSVPVDQMSKLVPALQKIVELAKAKLPAEEPTPAPEQEPVPAEDEDPEMKKEEEEKKFSDALAAAVGERLQSELKAHLAVVDKAREFLPEEYAFTDKAALDIMKDALAAATSENFEDAEIPTAFKLLRKTESQYKEFGDSDPNPYDLLKDKEL